MDLQYQTKKKGDDFNEVKAIYESIKQKDIEYQLQDFYQSNYKVENKENKIEVKEMNQEKLFEIHLENYINNKFHQLDIKLFDSLTYQIIVNFLSLKLKVGVCMNPSCKNNKICCQHQKLTSNTSVNFEQEYIETIIKLNELLETKLIQFNDKTEFNSIQTITLFLQLIIEDLFGNDMFCFLMNLLNDNEINRINEIQIQMEKLMVKNGILYQWLDKIQLNGNFQFDILENELLSSLYPKNTITDIPNVISFLMPYYNSKLKSVIFN
ncbi:hypothetical protein K502DRAFT_329541 [Neoconidiobolus thromboides FSU 785]|nr:hypothetical protein K502DRAFT_329541 [Neoconidiobolus thromboides FSU 785]